jgi:hypothetical protein
VDRIVSKSAAPDAAKAAEASKPHVLSTATATAKARQRDKLRELRQALIDEGCAGLSKQATALGIRRSTAWVVLSGQYKASGLTASVIGRMMSSPQLPPRARRVLQDYIEEKSAGLYGHDKKSVQAFCDKITRETPKHRIAG